MSANEIANRLIAQAVIQVQSSSNFRFVESVGFTAIRRSGTGLYELTLVQPLDFSVPPATTPRVARYKTVPQVYNLAANGYVAAGSVPIDVLPGGYAPGSIALAFYSDNPPTTLADDGICLLNVWQFPTID